MEPKTDLPQRTSPRVRPRYAAPETFTMAEDPKAVDGSIGEYHWPKKKLKTPGTKDSKFTEKNHEPLRIAWKHFSLSDCQAKQETDIHDALTKHVFSKTNVKMANIHL